MNDRTASQGRRKEDAEPQTLTSVRCYIEEHREESGSMTVRLREKLTSRKVEIWGTEPSSLIRFLMAPRFTGTDYLMPNIYVKDGLEDFVVVSGIPTVDTYDVIRFGDNEHLAYLYGPTLEADVHEVAGAPGAHSAYRTHARSARESLYQGRYREAVLASRLAVELACGGDGLAIKRRLNDAPKAVQVAANKLRDLRSTAVHEGLTRIEQLDAESAVRAMDCVIAYVTSDEDIP